MLPNFIFIGPDKSGSTWIFEALRYHPEVCMAKAKDIYFFDRYFDKGLKWYESLFSHCDTRNAVGEISHDYLFSEVACERIKRTIPNVKLITCLRDPVERAFSAYLFLVKHGLTSAEFSEAIDKFPELTGFSLYAKPIQRYILTFGRSRLLILRFEDLKSDPKAFATRIFNFIGVDPAFEPKVIKLRVLPASRPRIPQLAFLVKQGAGLLRAMGCPNIVGALKRSSILQKALYIPYSQVEYPTLKEKDRRFLRKLFEPDLIELERLLGSDFTAWRTLPPDNE